MKSRGVKFVVHTPGGDRVHHVSEEDVRVVLSRLPVDLWSRLRTVHFNDKSRGGRTLGYIGRSRSEIALCALPPRMSFTKALIRGQAPDQFGAKRGAQWSRTAIRRFMLYDVLLHELGHMQVIDETASARRKFARETMAHEFATYWRKCLWSMPFSHPDPIHNAPGSEESARLAET